MQIFLHHPDVYYYVRQLTRILDTQINSVRRELIHLEEIGMISACASMQEAQGLGSDQEAKKQDISTQKKFFKMNSDFILYPELKALFLKEQLMVEKDLAKNIRKAGVVNYLLLTGLFVGNDDAKTDMIIVGKVDPEKLGKIVSEYEKLFHREINYSVFSYNEYKYRLNINDRFLYDIINSKKIIAIDELSEDDASDSFSEINTFKMIDTLRK